MSQIETSNNNLRKYSKKNGIQLRSGSYWVVLREKDAIKNTSRVVWHGPFKDLNTAEIWRDNRKRELKAGTALKKDQITLNEYMAIWLEDHAMNKPLRPSTKATYEEKIRNYITPTLGIMPIQAIRAIDVKRWVTNLSQAGGMHGQPLAARTVRYVGSILKEALNAAIDEYELISINPSARIKLPMPKKSNAQVWEVAEMRAFFESSKDHRLSALFAVLAATGARRGEVLALTWKDIDLESATISISKAVAMVNGQCTVDQTKNANSRVVPIDPRTVSILRAHRNNQVEERLACAVWQESDLVFCHPDGTGLRPDSVYKVFQNLISKSGVRRIRLHDLRHTHATWLLDAGEHVYVVAERLGHTDPQTTARIYAHVTP